MKAIEMEVLPPEGKARENDFTAMLAYLLDDLVQIPGTKFRIGLDPVLSFIPGIGDASSTAFASLILIRAWKAAVPRVVLARMAANMLLNTLMGAIPGIGNVFTAFFKSNHLNYQLLLKHAGRARTSTTGDWVFLLTLLGVILAVSIGAALLFGFLVWKLLGVLFG